MEVRGWQKVIKNFNQTNEMDLTPICRGLDLSSEVGEIQKEVLLGTAYGWTEHKNTDNLKFEIGDVLYSLMSLGNETGLDLDECLQLSLNKMRNRFIKED